jgi:hypothetical protein
MCYPKPGPRCSASAAIRLAKATSAKTALKKSRDYDFEALAKVERELVEARQEFDITPAGLKFLKEEALQGEHHTQEKIRYDLAVALREEKLSALKASGLQAREQGHRKTVTSPTSGKVNFQDSSINRVDAEHEDIDKALIEDSEAWFASMDHEEMAQARWMTDYGAMEANKHIAGKNDYKLFAGRYSAANIEERMKVIDSALNKYEGTETIVYRGVRKGLLPERMAENWHVSDDIKKAEILKQFPVGGVYESDFYMPTTMKPSMGNKFSDFGLILEIKTKKAAPVAPLSISLHESERLIGRGSKFSVVDVKENVMFNGVPKTVIQLEQL